ncbi:hypothetical protein BDQ12DRAFT_710272 [Crucibulum laeve]|uniref:DRBM domain-containing protein n=1 Tax=Crucibulum laeve TaxID=68775 RepID=A0A5C3M8Z9_9AGAR|nr:hypothetical protein BDQ12DRAFT_710272 [Crucibulum laeve]
MSMTSVAQSRNDGTVKLNNYLQGQDRASSLSWVESNSGPSHAPTWKCVCKIDGKEYGTGTGSHKHIAKDIAATQALNTLTGENTS